MMEPVLVVERSDIYAQRCAFWIAESAPKFSRRVREREQRPLILTGHSLSLRVDKGSLLVRDGFTHFRKSSASGAFSMAH
jgi:CRISP-associated protein Cas1